jgi:hypothetical protein
MYYLSNFHEDYPDASVVVANCGDTVSLSCRTELDNNPIQSSSTVRISSLSNFSVLFFLL